MNLSIPQLVGLAANAGFSGDDLATAVAVALAESGGNPQAYNPEAGAGAAQGKGSYGLWQIYLTAHPEFAGTNLLDPQTNANEAFAVYAGAGHSFAPWSTFKSGAYSSRLASVQQVLDAAQPQVADSGQAIETASVTPAPSAGEIMAIGLAVGAILWFALRAT